MNKTTKTFTYIIGIVMTFAMVGSLILPMLSNQVGQVDSAADLPRGLRPCRRRRCHHRPIPPRWISATCICIDPDCSQLARQQAGFRFPTAIPADELRAGLGNSELLSVVEVRINKNHSGISDPDALSELSG